MLSKEARAFTSTLYTCNQECINNYIICIVLVIQVYLYLK